MAPRRVTEASKPPGQPPNDARASPLAAGVAVRLFVAALPCIGLWAAVAWALR